MRAVVQRVKEAAVHVESEIVGKIEQGLLVLICAEEGDEDSQADYFARKIAAMRIFSDENGKMNKSVKDINGSILVVSQFTLAADWKKGNRPGFSKAASPEEGRRLYEYFVQRIKEEGLPVQTGQFAADMQVSLVNDGPITIPMEG
ncbi:D-aminoacyl-tRNA deacylase [Curvivirga aplysinae]|uniref:D-aminoacyl-tRNA deacylase n=1 Tax=Curvivirga aplysinae TaxID=2529852 RepID=UPI0012BCC569|nr:D-aminoacyl-tRNA deacylase [Curvivirga aplysinae]MTI10135.1 D-tyrosyl-tRNA(Tyr) deacylase [Curvivirga aplysinae]